MGRKGLSSKGGVWAVCPWISLLVFGLLSEKARFPTIDGNNNDEKNRESERGIEIYSLEGDFLSPIPSLLYWGEE